MNQFISKEAAENRDVFCGKCGGHVKGHHSECLHCGAKFHANANGYARLCKNDSCKRTETQGKAHGLCDLHRQQRKERQARSAMQPTCPCGNKAKLGYTHCTRCMDLYDLWPEPPESQDEETR